VGAWLESFYCGLNQNHIGCVNDNSEVGAVADEFFDTTIDFGNQKAVFQQVSLTYGPVFQFFKDMLVETDDSSYVTVEFFLHIDVLSLLNDAAGLF
jgi:hypothetical protein